MKAVFSTSAEGQIIINKCADKRNSLSFTTDELFGRLDEFDRMLMVALRAGHQYLMNFARIMLFQVIIGRLFA